MCTAQMQPGEWLAACNVYVPAGKRFVIESASAGGLHPSSQSIDVVIFTKSNGVYVEHAVPAGFQVLNGPSTRWSGALPGTIFAETGHIQLGIGRLNDGDGSPYDGSPWIRMTLSGYFEDTASGLLR